MLFFFFLFLNKFLVVFFLGSGNGVDSFDSVELVRTRSTIIVSEAEEKEENTVKNE